MGQVLSALALAVLLCACRTAPKNEMSIGGGGDVSVPEGKTPQQLLEEQPRDENHDAFLVDTGGALGTLLIAVELDGRDGPYMQLSFSVWDPQNLDRPLQTMTKPLEALEAVGNPSAADADFDRYQDFGYMYLIGSQTVCWYYWLCDEERGEFTESPVFEEISWPTFDPEKKTVSGYTRTSAVTGIHTVHQ